MMKTYFQERCVESWTTTTTTSATTTTSTTMTKETVNLTILLTTKIGIEIRDTMNRDCAQTETKTDSQRGPKDVLLVFIG